MEQPGTRTDEPVLGDLASLVVANVQHPDDLQRRAEAGDPTAIIPQADSLFELLIKAPTSEICGSSAVLKFCGRQSHQLLSSNLTAGGNRSSSGSRRGGNGSVGDLVFMAGPREQVLVEPADENVGGILSVRSLALFLLFLFRV